MATEGGEQRRTGACNLGGQGFQRAVEQGCEQLH